MLRFTDEWYEGYLSKNNARKKSIARGLKAVVQYISPHAVALAALAKNPELIKGKQEHYLQVAIFDWLQRVHPDIYDRTHATPNGGKRAKKTAFTMKAEGQKKGYPDLSIDKACGVFHGFRMEVKYGNNKPTAEQLVWKVRLEEEGYKFVVVWSLEEAIREITEYISLEGVS